MEESEAVGSRSVDKVDQYRKFLYKALNSAVQNVEKYNEWPSLLEAIERMVTTYPQAFLAGRCSQPLTSHTPRPPLEEHEFLLWIISTLLRVAAQATSPSFRKSVTDIFKLTRIKDHFVFCYLLKELVELIADLSQLCCHGNDVRGENVVPYPIFLSHFQHTWNSCKGNASKEYDFYPWLIELQNYSHLHSLAICSLDILVEFVADLSQFCKEDINIVCRAMGGCLEHASLKIKQHWPKELTQLWVE